MKTTENELIQQALDDLVQMGLITDSGARRNGKVVYVLTPLGKSPEGQAALEAWERRESGERPC
jgi:DNA-binding PadR family transcriptional regulator